MALRRAAQAVVSLCRTGSTVALIEASTTAAAARVWAAGLGWPAAATSSAAPPSLLGGTGSRAGAAAGRLGRARGEAAANAAGRPAPPLVRAFAVGPAAGAGGGVVPGLATLRRGAAGAGAGACRGAAAGAGGASPAAAALAFAAARLGGSARHFAAAAAPVTSPLQLVPRPAGKAQTRTGRTHMGGATGRKQGHCRKYGPGHAAAHLKQVRISARKLNLAAKLIRGLSVRDAAIQLKVSQKKAGRLAGALLRSAQFNATQNHMLDAHRLVVKEAFVGKGVIRKKMWPHARGRTGIRRLYASHMTIVLEEKAAPGGISEAAEAAIAKATAALNATIERTAPAGVSPAAAAAADALPLPPGVTRINYAVERAAARVEKIRAAALEESSAVRRFPLWVRDQLGRQGFGPEHVSLMQAAAAEAPGARPGARVTRVVPDDTLHPARLHKRSLLGTRPPRGAGGIRLSPQEQWEKYLAHKKGTEGGEGGARRDALAARRAVLDGALAAAPGAGESPLRAAVRALAGKLAPASKDVGRSRRVA